MTLETKLEALLFWKGEPMTKKKAAAALGCTVAELDIALAALETSLSNPANSANPANLAAARGLRIMTNGTGEAAEIEMRTAPEMGEFIAKLTRDELVRDLGKAGLETLSIILYKGPIKRAEIDYIRGVNSSFIIRNLLVRGLIERLTDKDGQTSGMGRGYSYQATMDLLAHMGVAKLADLPEYAKVKAELEAFEAAEKEADQAPDESPESTEVSEQNKPTHES